MAHGTPRRWTGAFFTRIKRAAAIVAAVFPRKIRAVLARNRARVPTKARFTEVFGRITRRPPIRPIAVLSKIATWLPGRRPRLPIRPILRTKVFGRATKKPPIRPVAVFGRVAAWLLARKPRLTLHTVIRTRVFGYVTRRPPIQAIVTALVGLARAQRVRIRPSARFIRRFGYITRTPPVRAIRTLLFASKARALQVRIRGRARFTKVVRTFGAAVAAVFPRRIKALFARRRTPRVTARFTRVFGYITRRPPVRRIRAAFARARPLARTKVFLRRPIRALAIIARFPRKIRVALARRRIPVSPIRLRTRPTRVFGHPTRRPPIYRVRTVFARRRLPVHFMARFYGVSRGFFVPLAVHYLAAGGRVAHVPMERRRLAVPAEDRSLRVQQEGRRVKVPGEQRRLKVPPEDRRRRSS